MLLQREYCDWCALWFKSTCVVECEKCNLNICKWCMKEHEMCPNCKWNLEYDLDIKK